jgi:hypothetical protein
MRGGVYTIKGFSTDVQGNEHCGLGGNKRDKPQRGDLQQQPRTQLHVLFQKTVAKLPGKIFLEQICHGHEAATAA